MPKVLRIINRFNVGGITWNVSFLSKYLAPEYETLLIGGKHQAQEASSLYIPQSMGLEPVVIESMSRNLDIFSDRKAYKEIRGIIRDFKPDIVHTHAAKAGALGRWAARAEKVPVIVHTFHGHVFHSYFNPLKTALVKMAERRLASFSSAIVAISEKQKEELCFVNRICPPEKVHVIPLGFDLDRFRVNREENRRIFLAEHKLPGNRVIIGTIGRLTAVKNHPLFLRGIAKMKELGLCVLGIVAGNGEMMDELRRYAVTLGLTEEDLRFVSWVKETEKFYAACDIVALTSFNEGTPVSLVEAQASGCAVVSSKVGGVENVVTEKTGRLFASGDEASFFMLLKELCLNEALRKELGSHGWEQVGSRFHYTRLVEDMKRLYRLFE